MLSRRKLIVGALAAAVVLAPLQAYAASWVTLGSRTVNLFYDHDSIHVGLTSGLFTKIRLKVAGNTVFMRDLHVTFSSGAGVDIPVRFLFLPGTIGSITWLALNEQRISAIKHGFVVAGVADKGSFTYKKSRRGNAEIDRAFAANVRSLRCLTPLDNANGCSSPGCITSR